MEQFTRANPGVLQADRTSSVYSNESVKKTDSHLDYRDSTESNRSRPISMAPSYMSAAIPTRKPVAPRIATPATNGTSKAIQPASAPALAPVVKGVLVLAIAALPHSSTISNLEVMLKKGAYSTIVVMGNSERETELKQLKMNIYALLGKLSLEVGVHMDLCKSWTQENLAAAVLKAVEKGEPIYGVLCCPAFEGSENVDEDILALDESQLAAPWTRTVGFVHNIARSAMPRLRSHKHAQREAPGTFVVTGPTGQSPTSYVYKAACDAFIFQLRNTDAAIGLIVAYAEDVLIPEPEPEKDNSEMDVPVTQQAPALDPGFDALDPAEASPTKLWAMWDELGPAE